MADSEKQNILQEAEHKANIAVKTFNNASELCVKKFEEWAVAHKDATKEEAHNKLVGLVKTAIVSSNLFIMSL